MDIELPYKTVTAPCFVFRKPPNESIERSSPKHIIIASSRVNQRTRAPAKNILNTLITADKIRLIADTLANLLSLNLKTNTEKTCTGHQHHQLGQDTLHHILMSICT